MAEFRRNENGFIGFEYTDVSIQRDKENLYADGYQNFGWKLESVSNGLQSPTRVTMRFKRDRKIDRKNELTHYQRQFDSLVSEIEDYENSRTTSASIWAYSIGLIGTAFMAGSVFAMLAGMIPLMVILAIPAFVGWILPYFVFKRVQNNKTKKYAPLIEERYDAIYNISKQANALLA